jgi:CHAT domain
MSRAIVRVQDISVGGEDKLFFFLEEPAHLAGAHNPIPLNCDPRNEPFLSLDENRLTPEKVKAAGAMLLTDISNHTAVSTFINNALGANVATAIYVQLDSDKADLLPWEILFSQNRGFLGLKHNLSIGRIASLSGRNFPIERGFEPPLRILAVLAAANTPSAQRPGQLISAKNEWAMLRQAIANAGFEVEVHVLTCEDEIYKEIDQSGDLHVRAEYLSDENGLKQAIKDTKPHVLHFFCHGTSVGSRPKILLANRAEWVAGLPGSIVITDETFKGIPELINNLWLITLNCCEGAAGTDTRSLARSLMAAGTPVVVGMREAVALDDANLFCKEFYQTLFLDIKKYVDSGYQDTVLEWVWTLNKPRLEICRKYRNGVMTEDEAAAEKKEWMLPIIYSRPEQFRIRRLKTKPGLTADDIKNLQYGIKLLMDLRNSFAQNPNTDKSVLARFTEEIKKKREELYGE